MNNTPNPTILDMGTAWLNELRANGRSPKTVTTYAAALFSLGRFLRGRRITRARRIRLPHLEAWQQSLRDSGCTVATENAFTRIVGYWLRWQCDRGLLFSNPAARLQIPKVPIVIQHCPTHEETKQVLHCTSGSDPILVRDRALLEFAYATGARLAEIANLNVTDVNLDHKLARLLGKGDRERMVPMTHLAVRALKRYIKGPRKQLLDGVPDHDALFIGIRKGERLDAPGVADVFARASKRAHLANFTPHAFRRAFATHLIANKAHPAAVSDMLGHRSGYRHLASYVHPLHVGNRDERAIR